RQFFPALLPARTQHVSPARRAHARAEAVFAFSWNTFGLVSALGHGASEPAEYSFREREVSTKTNLRMLSDRRAAVGRIRSECYTSRALTGRRNPDEPHALHRRRPQRHGQLHPRWRGPA